MTTVSEKQAKLVEDFGLFDDWGERYQYIIDLGKQLPPFPEADQIDDNRIRGCQSQVWLTMSSQNKVMSYQATSDAIIVRGLIALLLSVYDGQPAAEIAESSSEFLNELGFGDHLSPTRQNGLHALLKAMVAGAVAHS